MTEPRPAIHFGALAPSLAAQLPSLGGEVLDGLQRDADAITRLDVRGLLARHETHSARRRLVRAIEREEVHHAR